MAEDQPTTELTIRDVLVQVDRRLTRMEEDMRLSDGRFERHDGKMDTKFEALQRDVNNRFQWLTGILLASWLSIMGTILLK